MPIPRVNYTRLLYYTRRFAVSNMRSSVTVVRKPPAIFDSATGTLESGPPTMVYSGIARIASVSGPLMYALGDEPQPYSRTTVSIPADTADLPSVDDLVTVVTHPGDDTVEGRVFRVTDVTAGGQWLAARQMQVAGVQESPHWPHLTEWDTTPATAVAGGGLSDFVGTP